MGGSKEAHQSSGINFVVPHWKVLQHLVDSAELKCDKPGVQVSNIDNFGSVHAPETKSFKLSFDGKKIAPGFGKKMGEVDLFGHEESPTKE